jgi:hypothetical protein
VGYLVNLEGYRPAKRNDGLKWTRAFIYESPTAVGFSAGGLASGTLIEMAVLADYSDPLNPPIFDFTTVNATAPSGLWYRIEFHDAGSGVQDSVPMYNGTVAAAIPDVEWIRATSQAEWDELGYPVPLTGGADPLENLIPVAVAEFQAVTGIDLTAVAADDKRIPLINKALRMFVEYDAASGQMEILETAADYNMVQSMSAGGYSETRRGIVQPNPWVLHPWPALNGLLNGIINFDTQGQLAGETPAIESQGVYPRPGSEIMAEGFHDRYRQRGAWPVLGPVWPWRAPTQWWE